MYKRQVFAGQLTHTDEQIGRIIATLKRTGKFENTLILVTSDNGASAEGGVTGSHNEVLYTNALPKTDMEENLKKKDVWGSEETNNHYNVGWAWAANTSIWRAIRAFSSALKLSHAGTFSERSVNTVPFGMMPISSWRW